MVALYELNFLNPVQQNGLLNVTAALNETVDEPLNEVRISWTRSIRLGEFCIVPEIVESKPCKLMSQWYIVKEEVKLPMEFCMTVNNQFLTLGFQLSHISSVSCQVPPVSYVVMLSPLEDNSI